MPGHFFTCVNCGDEMVVVVGRWLSKGILCPKCAASADEPAPIDPRSFHPDPGAQGLVIEVDEWIYLEDGAAPIATPDAKLSSVPKAWLDLPRRSRYVVVLEWNRGKRSPLLRSIGPTFDSLAEARAFGRAESARLKAIGPFGYRPADDLGVPYVAAAGPSAAVPQADGAGE